MYHCKITTAAAAAAAAAAHPDSPGQNPGAVKWL